MKQAGLDDGPREFDDLAEPLGRINQEGQRATTYRGFTDTQALRQSVLDGVKNAYANKVSENKQYALRFADVDYAKPKDFSLKDEKEALLNRRRLYWNLHGRLQLIDKATGQLISEDKEPRKLAEVPWLSRRGTWIHNGTEYLSFHQQRLKPGAYTRVQTNGDVETQFNVLKGSGFRVRMTPDTGVFKMKVGQGELKLYPVLKALGVDDRTLVEHWGKDLFNANKAADDKTAGTTLAKLVERLGRHDDQGLPADQQARRLPEILARMEMDPGVTKRTLGKPYTNVNHEVILAATKKILGVHKGEVDGDVRDDLPYQSFHGPEDFFREHVEKDAGQYLRQALWKASWNKDTAKVPDGYFTKQLQSVLMGSGLAATLTEINPIEIFDMRHKITRMGEGGIGSTDVVPKDARGVQPTHFGFIDAIRAPESQAVALDLRVAAGAKVGSDGRLYQDMRNARTGKLEPVTTEDIAEKIVAFPGELKKARAQLQQPTKPGGAIGMKWGKVAAMVGGKMAYVPADQVDYELPHAAKMWSPVTYMVPYMAGIKGQRVSMGARMQTQALALREPEAPFVRSKHPDTGLPLHREIGKEMGAAFADKPGTVKSVDGDTIVVQHDDGTVGTHELYNNFPLNQKGFLHNTAVVKPGDRVNQGDCVARSNYTDAKGLSAIGRNVVAVYHPYDGLTHEDAVVISESAAKKFASEQMYEFSKERSDDIHDIGKASYVAKFGGTFNKAQLDTLDENGVARVGTILKKDDPIILAVGKRGVPVKGSITKGSKTDFSDAAETWEHEEPGEVVDVRKTTKGWVVSTKAYTPSKVGDKLCYSEDTEVLTWSGWKRVSAVTCDDALASLGPCGQLEYLKPVALNVYEHSGRMYSLETTQVSLLVTENHHLYARPRNGEGRGAYGLHRADVLFGKTFKLKNNADSLLPGVDPVSVALPDYTAPAGQGGRGIKTWHGGSLTSRCFAFLLGAFLSEGCVLWQPDSGNYGVCISQSKPDGVKKLLAAFTKYGLNYTKQGDSFIVYGKALALLFSQFAPPGHGRQCHVKRIPQEVWGWTPELQFELFDWLVWGDGSVGKTTLYYITTSEGLAGDIQRLALHLGFAANIRYTPPKRAMVNGTECDCRARYDVVFYLSKNHPEINHRHHTAQRGQKEAWVSYVGKVYCPTLPRNHVLYVRRRGKAVWCGNSGLMGNKGIIAKVVPDADMLKTADGKTVDVVLNPAGIVSRVNPAQLAEASLGKIAMKTGKTYDVDGFPEHSIAQFALDELKKHGMNDTEEITDPRTGRKIKDVFVGVPYFMKLHHMAEGKLSARDTGGYSMDELPSRGGEDGAKRVSLMELGGLISHGATDFIEDTKLTRGQRNEDYWRLYRMGVTPPAPKVSKMYEKFEATLKAAGVHLRKEGSKTRIMPATQKEIDELAGTREITVADTVDFDSGDPVKGGLFDIGLTGGKDGLHWSHIKLAEPLPNPVVEEPIRSLLGLTKDRYRDIIAGKEDINGVKGPHAIAKALETFNVSRETAATVEAIKSGKKSIRDKMVKRLGFLKSFDRLGIHPRDFMLNKVPVLPPKFRPVTQFEGRAMSADANYLYKDLMEANHNVKATGETFGDAGEARLQLYDAFKAVTGLGGPITPENQERNVKGLLKQITGTSPKLGMYQRKIIGNPVDFSGRVVLAPGHDLDIDEVRLPVNMMWKMFKPFVVRRLVRQGMPAVQALKAIKERTPVAAKAFEAEYTERPVVINRAPSLTKLNMTGHFAKPTATNTLQVSNLILAGHQGDYDGDSGRFILELVIPEGTIWETYEGTPMPFSAQTSVAAVQRVRIQDIPVVQGSRVDISASVFEYDVVPGVQIYALDPATLEHHLYPVTKFSVHTDLDMRLVTLGKRFQTTLSVSADHSLICYKDGKVQPVKPDEAQGLVVPVVRHMDAQTSVASRLVKSVRFKSGPYSAGAAGPSAIPVEHDVQLTKDFGFFLGALIGDGWVDVADHVLLSNDDADVRDAWLRAGQEHTPLRGTGHVTTYEAESLGGRTTERNRVGLSCAWFARWLREQVGEGAKNKHIPSWCFEASDEHLLGILDGLMSTDGCVGLNTAREKPQLLISMSTISVDLVQDLQYLGRRLGFQVSVSLGKITQADNQSYVVTFSAPDFVAFQRRSGFSVTAKWKQQRLEQYGGDVASESSCAASTDLVPYPRHLHEKIRAIARGQAPSTTLADRATTLVCTAAREGYWSRSRALSVLENVEDPEFSDYLLLVSDNKITWKQVLSVEVAPRETGYDLTVPGPLTFATHDGVIVQDTLTVHVPVSDKAVDNVKEKMLPSKMLLSPGQFDVHLLPPHVFVTGLYVGSKKNEKKQPKTFETKAAAVKAYRSGEIDADDPVIILGGK